MVCLSVFCLSPAMWLPAWDRLPSWPAMVSWPAVHCCHLGDLQHFIITIYTQIWEKIKAAITTLKTSKDVVQLA